MGRPSAIWLRKGRGWHTTISGKQTFLGHDKKQAEREYHRLKLSGPRPTSRYSIPDLVKLYLSDCAEEVKAKTYKNYYNILKVWAHDFSRFPPSELRAHDLTTWLKDHPKWNPSSRHQAGQIVKGWSAWCDNEGYLDGDRLRKARLPTPLTRDAADPADLLRMEKAILSTVFLDFFQVLYDTGARPGEIMSLEGSRVHWPESVATVHGKTGNRVIGLSVRSVKILRLAQERYPAGPLLRTDRGLPWTSTSIFRAWTKWEHVAHTSRHIIPYHLRHALYVRWHDAGISDVVIAAQLGHQSKGVPHIKLLQSTYGHAEGRHLADAAQVASGHAKRRASKSSVS